MSEGPAPVDLVLLWHHHQPDYRHPRDRRSALPWVRLHASKDYLDMARRLEAHPGVRATFNFVPSLIDQIEGVAAGDPDELFELLARPLADLSSEARGLLAWRCGQVPPWALDRWPALRALRDRVSRAQAAAESAASPGERSPRGNGGGEVIADSELLALEIWFLLAWVDPMFLDAPEAARALAEREDWSETHRDELIRLHARLAAEVIPAYRALAQRGQIELSASPYYHPILPLLTDLAVARRARPDLALPAESLVAPEDARVQIERALARHAVAFGEAPKGMWPSEGSVSPEVASLAAACGLRWLASDEGVLWASLSEGERRRAALYRPWSVGPEGRSVAMFFRDHELSDRIGFVYRRWEAKAAAADFIARLRRIGRDFAGEHPPVVSVILDGENCWEHYPEDGGPFLEALYQALESSPDIRTRTPSQVLADGDAPATLPHLASGSWIDADFHIWIGHPEKNRAWDLLSRTRRALREAGATPATAPGAWESLYRAEGSDWFWWFGDDHHTVDGPIFDRLFRESLRAVYESAGLEAPASLLMPVVRRAGTPGSRPTPVGFIHPVLDGRRTTFYEWHAAGRCVFGAGGAMHHGAGPVRELHYGFDLEHLYLRLDFLADQPPGPAVDLVIEIAEPRPMRLRVLGLGIGESRVVWASGAGEGEPVAGARCHIERLLELGVPFASLGLVPGEGVALLVSTVHGHEATPLDADETGVSFAVPDQDFEATMWSA